MGHFLDQETGELNHHHQSQLLLLPTAHCAHLHRPISSVLRSTYRCIEVGSWKFWLTPQSFRAATALTQSQTPSPPRPSGRDAQLLRMRASLQRMRCRDGADVQAVQERVLYST
jgi:hypothetical protein